MNPLLPRFWRQRWQAWWRARQPRSDQLQLTHRNVYILPTPAGLAYLLTQGLLLVASINDQLNLGYALTFLLLGAGLVSMHRTHANLRGLQLGLLAPEPGHVGDDLKLRVRLGVQAAQGAEVAGRTRRVQGRFGLALRVADAPPSTQVWVDVGASQAELELHWQAPRRGHWPVPTLRLETRFPLGLFVAWAYWQPASRQWVYPQAEADAPRWPRQGRPPANSAEAAEAEPVAEAASALPPPPPPGSAAPQDREHANLRTWRPGDSLRHVHWKKAAQVVPSPQAPDALPPLWVFDAPPQAEAPAGWIDAFHVRELPAEAACQRLCAWVLEADAAGSPWGLILADTVLPLGSGAAQREAALQRLALA